MVYRSGGKSGRALATGRVRNSRYPGRNTHFQKRAGRAVMEIDPNNPVVRLCAGGGAAEMKGRVDEATRLYREAWEAWEARQDDYEACIVSHYLARVQRTPNEVL